MSFKNCLFFSISLLLLLTTFCVFAEDENNFANVFIHTNPINANILIDDTPILQKSPAFMQKISVGKHKIGIRKKGFEPIDVEVNIEDPKTFVIEVSLANGFSRLYFPDAKKIVFGKGEQEAKDNSSISVPNGNYSIKNESEAVSINPIYDKELFFYLNTGLFFLSAGATIISGIIEYNTSGELFFPHSTSLTVFESLALISGLTDLALLIDRKNFLDEKKLDSIALSTDNNKAEKIYSDANKCFYERDLERAISGFTKIISNYPDFEKFPEALYTIARIHLIMGESNLAASELRIILSNYPDARVYDKTCQKLSIIYYKNGKKEKSLNTARRMVFYDPIFENIEQDIEAKGIESIIEEWVRTTSGEFQND